MSKIGLFILALANNGIENYIDYTLEGAKPNGDITVKHKDGLELTIDVHGNSKEDVLKAIMEYTAPTELVTEIISKEIVKEIITDKKSEVIIPMTTKTKDTLELMPNGEMETVKSIDVIVETPIVKEVIEEVKEEIKEEIKEEVIDKKKYPRGWQFRNKFVDKAGNVYFKGKIQADLKGTLDSSDY